MKHVLYKATLSAILLTAVLGEAQNPRSLHEIERSLLYSCLDKPFLSVSASAPAHDAPPTVKLALIDPAGRVQPRTANKKLILKSRYAEVIEIPNHPYRSKALAIEICDPLPGTYHLTMEETGTQPYRITVRGVAPNVSSSEILKHKGQNGRIRSYYFGFWIDKGEAHIQWLDETGHSQYPRLPLEIGEW